MSTRISIGKQLDVLYETGSKLAVKFAEHNKALQERQKDEQKKAEPGTAEEKPKDALALATKDAEFELGYQRWYSISLSLMKQFAPDRYAEFQTYYQPDPKREDIDCGNYVMQDYFRCLPLYEDSTEEPWQCALRCFLVQLVMVKATQQRLEWQELASEDAVSRCMYLDELQTAQSLLTANERAAGALAGTVLGSYLRKLALKHQVKVRSQTPAPQDLIEPLKAAQVIDIAVGSQITWIADIHRRCLQAEGSPPTKLQVRDLLDGTRWLLTNVF